MAQLRRHGLNGVNIGESRHLTEAYIKKFTAAGISVYVYTVNDPLRAQQLFTWGVEGVTTDRIAWMKQQIINPL
jgi:glycerophosphoryl diester phosphodiesterase